MTLESEEYLIGYRLKCDCPCCVCESGLRDFRQLQLWLNPNTAPYGLDVKGLKALWGKKCSVFHTLPYQLWNPHHPLKWVPWLFQGSKAAEA